MANTDKAKATLTKAADVIKEKADVIKTTASSPKTDPKFYSAPKKAEEPKPEPKRTGVTQLFDLLPQLEEEIEAGHYADVVRSALNSVVGAIDHVRSAKEQAKVQKIAERTTSERQDALDAEREKGE